MNTARLHMKSAACLGPYKVLDAFHNALHCRGDKRILITRHAAKATPSYRDFFAWIRGNVPELFERIEFHRLPCRIRDWSRYSLHVSWAGDTFLNWDRRGYASAATLEAECRARGIPVINPVTNLANAQKSACARKLTAVGIRTPQMRLIQNLDEFRETAGGLPFPLLIREDRGHGKPSIFVPSPQELRSVDLSGYEHPIAAEFIETRDPRDGLYHKYRYVAIGPAGQPRHINVNDQWEVRPERRIMNDDLRREELEYLAGPDPNQAVFQRARRALGLDVVGFDYSYDLSGRVVVWEANPFPDLNLPKLPVAMHIAPKVKANYRLLAAYYVHLANLPVPKILGDAIKAYTTESALPVGVAAA